MAISPQSQYHVFILFEFPHLESRDLKFILGHLNIISFETSKWIASEGFLTSVKENKVMACGCSRRPVYLNSQ